jgi:hypothetical protein
MVREKIKQKKASYIGAFQERDQALTLCDELQLLRDNFLLAMDQNTIEEEMFDRVIGATPPQNDGSGPKPTTERDVLCSGKLNFPILT